MTDTMTASSTVTTGIAETLAGLTGGTPTGYGNMAMVPLLAAAADARRSYLILDEALAAGSAQISELSTAGDVPISASTIGGSSRCC